MRCLDRQPRLLVDERKSLKANSLWQDFMSAASCRPSDRSPTLELRRIPTCLKRCPPSPKPPQPKPTQLRTRQPENQEATPTSESSEETPQMPKPKEQRATQSKAPEGSFPSGAFSCCVYVCNRSLRLLSCSFVASLKCSDAIIVKFLNLSYALVVPRPIKTGVACVRIKFDISIKRLA